MTSSGGPTDADNGHRVANLRTAERLEAALERPERERMAKALDTLIAILGWAIEREAEAQRQAQSQAQKGQDSAPFSGSRMSTR